MNEQTQNSQKVYQMAKSCLGKVLSGDNSAYGCAETVNNIFLKALGQPIGGGYSTYSMYAALQDVTRFMQVSEPLAGDVIISPTGYGNTSVMPNGHVGIVGEFGILSNSSEDGELHENYTLNSWTRIFNGVGGYPVEFFRVI